MSLFNFFKQNLFDSVSSCSLNTAGGIVFAQKPLLLENKSFYQTYLEERDIIPSKDNRALTSVEMDALFQSFSFKTPPNRKTDEEKIKKAFSLLNEKSPTGRTLLKQLPCGLEFNTCNADPEAVGWVFFNKKTVFLDTKEFLEHTLLDLAALLAHECSHVIEQCQITMFNPEGKQYYSRLNYQSVHFRDDLQAQTRDAFLLRKISEAEKISLEYQIYAEINDVRETVKQAMLLPVYLFKSVFGGKQKKAFKPQFKENIVSFFTHFLINEQSVIPSIRYYFFKSVFSYKYRKKAINNESLTPKEQQRVRQDYIQNKAAKKAMSCSMRDILNVQKFNKKFWFFTGAQLAASTTSFVAPNPMSLLYIIGLPLIMDAVRYKDSLVQWNRGYDTNTLGAIVRNQEPSLEDSCHYTESVLSALIDKYDGFLSHDDLTKCVIPKNSSYNTHIEIAQKTAQLSYRVFSELETFCQIKAYFLNKDAQIEDVFNVKKELVQWAEEDMSLNQEKSLDESIRTAILSQFYYEKMPVDAKGLDGNTMLHVTRDPRLILLLLDKGADLKRKNKECKTPLQLLSKDLSADNEVRQCFVWNTNQQNISKMLSLLVALGIQVQKQKKVSLQSSRVKKNMKRRFVKERA